MATAHRYTLGMVTVAERIRRARHSAGLSQAEVARSAGTSQPAVNRYERGKAEPSAETLERILAACSGAKRASKTLLAHRDEVIELLRRQGARTILVFGSVARGEDGAGSDVDLLVDHLDEGAYAWGVPQAKEELERLLGVPVDIGEVGNLRPRVLHEALVDARPL